MQEACIKLLNIREGQPISWEGEMVMICYFRFSKGLNLVSTLKRFALIKSYNFIYFVHFSLHKN